VTAGRDECGTAGCWALSTQCGEPRCTASRATGPTVAAWVDARLPQQVHVCEAVPQGRLEVLQVLRRRTQQLQMAIMSRWYSEQQVLSVCST
jgi:hypothetical protein